MNLERKANGWMGRFRCGKGPRIRVTIVAPDEATAQARAARLRARVDGLVAAGMPGKAAELLQEAATQRTERAFAGFERAMRDVALEAGSAPAAGGPRTFGDVVELWLSGEIHRRWPDVCQSKAEESVAAARLSYGKVIHPLIGAMPVADITLADADKVKEAVAHLTPSTRRKYTTIVRMCLDFAVYPLGLIAATPIPRKGFVPRVGKVPEFQFLYPDEEALIVGDPEHALVERFYLAFMFRNGLRASEGLRATWGDVDFKRGGFTMNVNKTDRPRLWKLDDDVLEACRIIRESLTEGGEDTDPLFPGAFPEVGFAGGAQRFRRMLKASGVTRKDLHEPTGNLSRIRLHDTRATFCTLALASGRSDQWVMDRTGHTTGGMLERYRRRARSAREFDLGWLVPMPQALKLGGDGGVSTGSGTMCSNVVQGVGQSMGLAPVFEPKKARRRGPPRGPLDTSRTPQDAENPANLTSALPGMPGDSPNGPPEIGGEGRVTDATGRQILVEAIGRASAAGQWAIVERLSRVLDGSAVAAPSNAAR
jgi:integrase